MPIFIYNSLTRKKEEFIPAVPLDVKMYTCGVTVYDDCHIGHARSLFIFDYIKRYLTHRGYKVKLVRNITDVDDKIIRRAREEGAAFDELRLRYIKNYTRDLAALEISKADFEPLATENIHYMVGQIKQLLAAGFAYEAGGDVYFAVRSFKPYGRLSGQSLEQMLTAVRIEKDEKKKDPLDFALWKKSKEGEPSWASPWGPGRPGWHIECSTMSLRFLRTETLDIHAGGRDLIFPHHENEIAQAEGATTKTFAKYWLHHGLLTIGAQKMSKSLGNFITIQDILKKYSPNVLKLFFLSAHYSSGMDFSYAALEQTKKADAKIGEFLDKTRGLEKSFAVDLKVGPECETRVRGLKEDFESAMDDDFNTAKGLAVFFELLNFGNKCLAQGKGREGVYAAAVLQALGALLGLSLAPPAKLWDLAAGVRIKILDASLCRLEAKDIERFALERVASRNSRDFKRADEIRDYLKQQGVILEDTEKQR